MDCIFLRKDFLIKKFTIPLTGFETLSEAINAYL